ncbi:3-hydroxyacyl-CoA dehydrogenase NAD-binding domain-containing protein [Hyphomicrobium sp.]|jgi:3-hydroxyacyl-CoA dehydrogenase/enoyl-CoA hydratase/3-hydroxybutyryl-CoA epimerase|uniref:3-hydroxyacyl-CoA dehydrogenase NAD-binding domain-containing protein n=1 Tax=Hyphomicrobium sp. TaxID=82 RepID=UPI002C443833|nr:3-hydroxyacyl-CoA dehydrogenase NAD-binding domain-containing protein [Hyphomicrobium sp.]HVZ03774.1 3-hydroxyacyl-CoA dehydrogenase NAD-binding domain-containing protein [Hyphomicrobium sp.]
MSEATAQASVPKLKDWRFSIDGEGIAWATFDREGESANALGRRPIEELDAIIERVEAEARAKTIRGLVIMSGKERGFIVGADIREFETFQSEQDVIAALKPVNGLLDRIEKLPVPVVAAIHGVCVGGGLELILACHYRIATRDESTRIGFPEVKLGIFPGFNGTARSIKQVGPMAAMQAMLTGGMIRATVAKAQGFIDQLVGSPGELHWAARKAVLQNRRSKSAGIAKMLLTKWPARGLLAAKMRQETAKKVREDHYPAPFRLIDLFEKDGGDLDAMKKAETKAFAPLMMSETARNLRRVFRLTELLKGQAPKGFKWRPSRVHVIGAGTMGADIAGVCVASGMEVTLQDISPEQLEKGIKAQGKLFARKFKTKATRDAAKARLIADPTGKGVARADVVIEAIVERLDIKQKLFADLEAKIKPGAVLATNTSSLKLEDISAPMKDPGRLIGLHFFSPVPQMPLVEVVRGAQTHDDDVKKGAVFVTSIDKFPLITKDVPGFLVNKVLTPYMFAAMKRLEEGEDKEKIDEAVRTFGMPMGPIELADNVGLDICAHVAKILGHSSEGSRLDRLVASGRLGKKTGEGFYVWKDGKPVKSDAKFSKAELERLGRELVEPMIVEAQKTLDEGVVESADLVDAGMIFGTGFAPFRGGPLHYKKTHPETIPASATRAAAE